MPYVAEMALERRRTSRRHTKSSPSGADLVVGLSERSVLRHRRLYPGAGSCRGCVRRSVQKQGITGAAVGCTSGDNWCSQPFQRLAELDTAVWTQQIGPPDLQ